MQVLSASKEGWEIPTLNLGKPAGTVQSSFINLNEGTK